MDITIALGIIIVFLLMVIICYLLVFLEIMNEREQILEVRRTLKKLIMTDKNKIIDNLFIDKKWLK